MIKPGPYKKYSDYGYFDRRRIQSEAGTVAEAEKYLWLKWKYKSRYWEDYGETRIEWDAAKIRIKPNTDAKVVAGVRLMLQNNLSETPDVGVK